MALYPIAAFERFREEIGLTKPHGNLWHTSWLSAWRQRGMRGIGRQRKWCVDPTHCRTSPLRTDPQRHLPLRSLADSCGSLWVMLTMIPKPYFAPATRVMRSADRGISNSSTTRSDTSGSIISPLVLCVQPKKTLENLSGYAPPYPLMSGSPGVTRGSGSSVRATFPPG
jgi:hypothetical protein